MTRFALMMVTCLVVVGCGNRNSVNDLRIHNAPNLTGYERVAICDTCGARSECGTASSTFPWATDHYKATGHREFTRQSCQSALGGNWKMGARSTQGREPLSLEAQRQAADNQLTKGIRINDARLATGSAGVTETSTPDHTTIRFRQTVSDGVRTSSRDAWAEFDSIGLLTTVRFGPWRDEAGK